MTALHSPLVGASPRIRQVIRLTEKMADSRWPVLILGETGTGKEVVARAIHKANPVGPFVTVDCSSLVGPLMESELFGHAKGSFTGAVGAKMGLIETADGGTAFFDEIGELPLDMQVKLLRVLQEKEFRPVGSLATHRSDFRVIAATNRNLAAEVEKGTFRRDLFYRLNVITIRLSPLRDRREDIPALVAHFMEKHHVTHDLSPEVLSAMMEYDWPGNVRELENCVQHMVALNSGPTLHMVDLPSSLLNHQERLHGPMPFIMPSSSPAVFPSPVYSPPVGPPSYEGPIVPLEELERRAILHALDYTKGDRAVAASLLGIGRTTLYRKLKEYKIESKEQLA